MKKHNFKFSICIPVWEMAGVGLQYLNDLLNSIHKQTIQDFEIIISDHSRDDKISNYILGLIYHNYFASIKYKRYEDNYGNGVSNLNNSLEKAEGEIIKIMFQDDLMFSEKCLERFSNVFKNDVDWAVCGCNHTKDGVNFERPMIPRWNDRLLEGINTISSPSVLAVRNKNIELFDENLTMLMDVEYYYRMNEKFGNPKIIDECLISNREHPNRISSTYTKDVNFEKKYLTEKYFSK